MIVNQVDNSRIAKNTLFLYFRMLLIMAVQLYASRVILQQLGEVDYGIYSVVAGLDMGAEDYIVKPFRPRELLSRIRGVLRRSGGRDAAVRIRNLTVDTEKGTVEKDGKEISLSALEYRLLLVFLNNRGRLLSRNRLLDHIWDAAGDFVNDNTLTVYIKRLREKIEDDPQEPAVIKTVRGLGYRVD